MEAKHTKHTADCPVNCLLTGPEHGDEPTFVLRAQDRWAPTLVRLWAELAEASGAPPAKIAKAREAVDQMLVWQEQHGRKTPD